MSEPIFIECPRLNYGQIVYIATTHYNDFENQPMVNLGVFETKEEAEEYLRGCYPHHDHRIFECPVGGAYNVDPFQGSPEGQGKNNLRFVVRPDKTVEIDPEEGVSPFATNEEDAQ